MPPGIKPPPSLVNMFKELASDLGIPRPQQGMLEPWAQQGVLLLNTCLTVRAGAAGSHRGQGWETLTDAILQAVQSQEELTVFVFWGADAQKKKKLIDSSRHPIIESAHPSPLSARTGFFGSRPFSRINAALKAAGRKEIDWQLNTEHHFAMPPAAVLLIAHGSRRAEANQDLQNLSARVAQKLPHLIVETAYLELTQPTIPEGAAACVSRGATRVMMTPYFLSAGNHVREDLEGFRQDFTAQYPGVTFQLGEPLGTHPLMTEIVLDQIRSFPE